MLTRRTFLQAAVAQQRPLPNIILFLADDLGSNDLSCYGSPTIKTPNIDALARDGVKFTLAYANAPECTPTRTALLTGRYQQRVGGLECAIGVGNVGRYDEAVWLQKRGELGLPDSEVTLPRLLKKAGYSTALAGKWHLGYEQKFWPSHHGFDESEGILGGNADYYTHKEEDGRPVYFRGDEVKDRTGHTTDCIADAALEFLKKQKSSNPFFLYVPFTAPHAPLQPGYKELVEHMDSRIGGILNYLEQSGAAKNTIVLFLSDNGADPNGSNAPLRGRKTTLFEGGIRIPLLMRWPGVIQKGSTFDQPALTMDLLPTLAQGSSNSDGVNLLPALTGKGPLQERALFWRYRRLSNNRKAVRLGHWKLIHDNANRFLFNLKDDPQETNNLYSAEAAMVTDLEDRLAQWELQVRAPRVRDM